MEGIEDVSVILSHRLFSFTRISSPADHASDLAFDALPRLSMRVMMPDDERGYRSASSFRLGGQSHPDVIVLHRACSGRLQEDSGENA